MSKQRAKLRRQNFAQYKAAIESANSHSRNAIHGNTSSTQKLSKHEVDESQGIFYKFPNEANPALLIPCPVCSINVKNNRMDNHVFRVHHGKKVPGGYIIIKPLVKSNVTLKHSQTTSPEGISVNNLLPTSETTGNNSSRVLTTQLLTDESGRVISYRLASAEKLKPKTSALTPVQFSTCKICGIHFPAAFIDVHYRNTHLVKIIKNRQKFECIICKEALSGKLVREHRRHCGLKTR